MERFDAFCQAVCRQVRHATPRERRAIRAELTGHLEDRAEDLRQRGDVYKRQVLTCCRLWR